MMFLMHELSCGTASAPSCLTLHLDRPRSNGTEVHKAPALWKIIHGNSTLPLDAPQMCCHIITFAEASGFARLTMRRSSSLSRTRMCVNHALVFCGSAKPWRPATSGSGRGHPRNLARGAAGACLPAFGGRRLRLRDRVMLQLFVAQQRHDGSQGGGARAAGHRPITF